MSKKLKSSPDYDPLFNRIIEICESNGTTVSELLDKVVSSRSAISAWKKGNISANLIETIANYLNVSIEFLITGNENRVYSDSITAEERELLTHFSKLSDKSKGIVIGRAEQLAEQDTVKSHEPIIKTKFIELSPMSVSAGSGEPLLDDSYPEMIKIKVNERTREASFAVQINGNSMEPYYNDNDIVLVKSQPSVELGQVGIFIIDGTGYIKERGSDRLISLNTNYGDIYFSDEQDIRCKGLVVGTLNEEDII